MAERVDPQTKKILEACPDVDSTTELSLNHLKDLRLAVCSLTARWYNMGVSLGIPSSKLDEFRSKYRDPDRCLTCTLAEWITNCNQKFAPPTWRKLIIAVASRVGADNPALARRIALQQNSDRGSTQDWANVDSRKICPTDKGAVLDALLKVATKWVAIGILFDIPYERLQIYEAEEDLEKRVSRLVEAWIDNELGSKPTWKRLVEVIASKAGGDHQALAKKLASDHQPSEAEEQVPLVNNDTRKLSINKESLPPDVFRKDDIAFLMKELRDVAPKWLIFCPQLGIPMSEVHIIAANPMFLNGAPVTYLQAALYDWICHRHPTLTVLCEALRSEVVGENALAEQFVARFWKYRS